MIQLNQVYVQKYPSVLLFVEENFHPSKLKTWPMSQEYKTTFIFAVISPKILWNYFFSKQKKLSSIGVSVPPVPKLHSGIETLHKVFEWRNDGGQIQGRSIYLVHWRNSNVEPTWGQVVRKVSIWNFYF